MEDQKSSKFVVPGAIIIAGLLIAGAVVYKKSPPANTGAGQQAAVGQNQPNQPSNQPSSPESSAAENIKPVTAGDYFLGNPDAAVTIVLYTDMVCPYCKRFHTTMKQVMDEYGKTGKLKWVVRHFPLESIHPRAKSEAIATECAADQGGSEKFFAFMDRVFETSPAEGFDTAGLLKIAEYTGLNSDKFNQCLSSGKFDQKIKDTVDDATKAGILGTPFSAVIGLNEKTSEIPGALPYSDVKAILDAMLAGN